LRRTAGKNGFTLERSSSCCHEDKKHWPWYLAILALFAALTPGSCANQEGVAPNEAELSSRN
jgi:hypothetical protein